MTHDPETAIDINEPAIGISIMHQVGADLNITLQSHVPQRLGKERLDATLDMMAQAAKRQSAIMRLPELRKRLAVQEKTHIRANEDMFTIDQRVKAERDKWESDWKGLNRRGDWKPTSVQQQRLNTLAQERQHAETSFKRHAEDIALVKKEIAECEAIIEGK